MFPVALFVALHGPAAAGADADLTVATWNTRGLPAPLALGRGWRLSRIRGSLRQLGADVVAFQEVWGSARSLLQGPRVVFEARAGDSGLGLYTPHARTPPRILHFSHARGWDRLKRKGALQTTIDAPTGPVHVVAVHLQSGDGERAAGVRAAQVAEVLSWIATLSGPVVLLGDVNFTADRAGDLQGLQELAAAGFVDAATDTGATDPTWGGLRRLDRIYVRGGLEAVAVRTGQRFEELSDHVPVFADLRGTVRP